MDRLNTTTNYSQDAQLIPANPQSKDKRAAETHANDFSKKLKKNSNTAIDTKNNKDVSTLLMKDLKGMKRPDLEASRNSTQSELQKKHNHSSINSSSEVSQKNLKKTHKADSQQTHRTDSQQTHKTDSQQIHKTDSQQTHRTDSQKSHKIKNTQIHPDNSQQKNNVHTQKEFINKPQLMQHTPQATKNLAELKKSFQSKPLQGSQQINQDKSQKFNGKLQTINKKILEPNKASLFKEEDKKLVATEPDSLVMQDNFTQQIKPEGVIINNDTVTSPKEVDKILRQMVSKIASSIEGNEVKFSLKNSVLPGTDISINRSQGELTITINVNSEDVKLLLLNNESSLQKSLNEKFNNDKVNIQINLSQDNQNSDGRSKNEYIQAEDAGDR